MVPRLRCTYVDDLDERGAVARDAEAHSWREGPGWTAWSDRLPVVSAALLAGVVGVLVGMFGGFGDGHGGVQRLGGRDVWVGGGVGPDFMSDGETGDR